MPLTSQISSLVANQLGRLQGDIEAQVQTEAINLLSKFANRCPDSKELTNIVKTRNNLLKSVNSFQKILNRLRRIPATLRRAISIAKRIIRLLKRSPVKLAIGTRPSFTRFDRGGLFSTKTAGYVTTQADRLFKVNKRLEDLEDDLATVNELLDTFDPGLNSLRGILEGVNDNITECARQLEENEKDKLNELLSQIRPLENVRLQALDDENYNYRAANGKDYALEIIEDNSIESSVPRRLAVAKDKIGVIVLRGQPSFSSDTKILLDELKFRLDNQLP